MPNEVIDATTDRSRRQYLAALGTGAIAALAGCGGDDATGTDDDGDEEDDIDPATETPGDDQPVATDDAEEGETATVSGEGECPAPPSEYERQTIFTGGSNGEPDLTAALPQASYISFFIFEQGGGNQIQFDFGDGNPQSLQILKTFNEDMSLEEAATGQRGSEVTDEYDLAVDAGRVFEVGPDQSVPGLHLLLDAGNGGFSIELEPTDPEMSCPDLVIAIRDRVATSLRPPA